MCVLGLEVEEEVCWCWIRGMRVFRGERIVRVL